MQNKPKRGRNWGLIFLLAIVAGKWIAAAACAYRKWSPT